MVSNPSQFHAEFKNKKTLQSLLDRTECVVFDEADASLEKDGVKVLKGIHSTLSEVKNNGNGTPQFIFAAATFPTSKSQGKSATLTNKIAKLFPNIDIVSTEGHHRFSDRLRQTFIPVVSDRESLHAEKEFQLKLRATIKIIRECLASGAISRIIIFCRSKLRVVHLHACLNAEFSDQADGQLLLESIHDDVPLDDRTAGILPFLIDKTPKERKISVLMGTDFLSRGFDFRDISVILSFDFPADIATYLHRVGRAARFEKTGEAISFVAPRDATLAKLIETTLFDDGYSLWIGAPKESIIGQQLVDVVNEFGDRLGTPKWQPHITLLGQVTDPYPQLEKKLQSLCQNIKPFKVLLTDIVTRDLFFQCVMAKVEEASELMDFNRMVAEIFPRPDSIYWPHLSLVYGDLTADLKASVQEEIRTSSKWSIVGSMVEVKTVEVWSTEGPVHTWFKAGEINLHG
ncbi:hypothetical protein HDU67_001713 [Dinochytrium kinnereticum]|nr:hypothetical protein HDU67_001713 [Dinochytrium kinnereticum]